MKVGITGASGFIGRRLTAALRARGHGCIAFSRHSERPEPLCAETRPLQSPDVGGLDAIINLAGESILGRWTRAKKRRILDSRVQTTGALAFATMKAAAEGGPAPRAFISASAIGFYGHRGEEVLDETRPVGTGFLAETCQRWEASAQRVESSVGVRVAQARFGLVLGGDGGAYPSLRKIFRFGLGGRLGSGRQWMSPIHVDDAVGLLVWLLENGEARGAYNAVCPEPLRNADFTAILSRALRRPAVLPAPAFALRLALGEMSHLLLDSARVFPRRAQAGGFAFRYPDLPAILAELASY